MALILQASNAQENFAMHDDTLLVVKMNNVDVVRDRKWSNDTVRYQYNQMKYYVKIVLPYLDAAAKMLAELNEMENNPAISKKERKAFIKTREEELHRRFDEEISKLNETQGVLLIKLIARQSGDNIYSKLEEYKNLLFAVKWQTYARLHGFNLNKHYDPNDEPMLEHIMESLGYPLPAVYGQREDAMVLRTY